MNAQERDQALSKAKLKFLIRKDSVFLATVCSSLMIKWDTTIPYGATDGKNIYLNPKTFFKLSLDEQVFLLAHETLHVAYQHMNRLGSRDARKFNVAADYVINLELTDQGFTMIQGGLLDRAFAELSTEEVYDLLENEQNSNNQSGTGYGSDIIYNANPTEEDIEHINDILIQASMVAERSNQIGSIPASIKRYLDDLKKPKVNWKVLLRRFFQDLDAQSSTWRRPKKRYLPVYLPITQSQALSKLTVAVDTSGSVDEDMFNQFVSEIAGIFRFLKPKEIEVIQFDAKIQAINKVKNINHLRCIDFIGGGGTDIKEVFDHFERHPTKGLIIITDGYLDTDLSMPRQPVLWAVFDNPYFTAPFGRTIHFEA